MNKVVESAWRQYAERVVPSDAPEVQMQETRRAFYAGASMVVGGLLDLVSTDEEVTEGDLQLMVDIRTEIEQFVADVVAGRK